MSSSEITGAPSGAPLATVSRDGATPSLADQWEAEAIDAIAHVHEPEEAERLLGKVTLAAEAMRIAKLGADRERRWGVLKLKAERRWGKLLGEPEPGKAVSSGHRLTNGEKAARKKARKVKDVPQSDFDTYVATASKSSREGLLKPKTTPVKPPRKQRQPNAPKRRPSESGRRLRQLHGEKQAGRTVGDLWHLQKAIAESVGLLERFDLPSLNWSEEKQMLVSEIYDDLARHARWTDTAIDAVTARMGDMDRQRLLQTLRARADDPSSTQNERTTAARLAEKLARRNGAKALKAPRTGRGKATDDG